MSVISRVDVPLVEADEHHGMRIEVTGVGRTTRRGTPLLADISFTIEPGEVVAIIGGSGAGKSTLLDALAGVRPPSTGAVAFDGVDTTTQRERFRGAIGYVPQDDIIHLDLPVAATLRYAAQLRLAADTPRAAIDDVVRATLRTLDLESRADVRVGLLSGGQRKRASIGVELLTRPRAFFLDEPTSGLDPATSRALLRTLRQLATDGTTVVLTTHNTDDLAQCDRVVVLSRGRLVFAGSPDRALQHFGAVDYTALYECMANVDLPRWEPPAPTVPSHDNAPATRTRRPPAVHQWRILTRRNVDVLRHNRLTLAIMLGSPALVTAMFAVLFQPGAFDPSSPAPSAAVAIAYWIAFAGFFFGLTYGLLQIVTEHAILRRERFVVVRVGPYLLAKATVLIPVLLAVTVTMLATLRWSGRLPPVGTDVYVGLTVIVLLDAIAALALGLLASAAVADPAQATLALPMLCFPAVLFSGAVLPVPGMAAAGRLLSVITSDRWAYEAIGRALGVEGLLTADQSGNGPRLLSELGGTFTGGVGSHSLNMVLFTGVFLAGAYAVVWRRTRPV